MLSSCQSSILFVESCCTFVKADGVRPVDKRKPRPCKQMRDTRVCLLRTRETNRVSVGRLSFHESSRAISKLSATFFESASFSQPSNFRKAFEFSSNQSFYFLLIYIHISRNLFYHSFKLNYV